MCWAPKNFRLSAVPIGPIKDLLAFDKWKLLHKNCHVFVFHMMYGVIRLIKALMKYTQITSNLAAPFSQFFYPKNALLSGANSQNLNSTNVAGCTMPPTVHGRLSHHPVLFWPSLKAHNHVTLPHDVHWCVFSPLTAVKPRWKAYLWRRHTLDVSRWIVGWTERTYRLYWATLWALQGRQHAIGLAGRLSLCYATLHWHDNGTAGLARASYRAS